MYIGYCNLGRQKIDRGSSNVSFIGRHELVEASEAVWPVLRLSSIGLKMPPCLASCSRFILQFSGEPGKMPFCFSWREINSLRGS